MNKKLLIALGIIFLLSFGCIFSDWQVITKPANTGSTSTQSKEGEPYQISYFYVTQDWYEDAFSVSVEIDDQYGESMAAPGTMSFSIVDDNGAELYNSTLYLTESAYNKSSYEYGWLNTSGYEYSWNVPYSKIKKSNSTSSTATAHVYFTPEGSSSAMYSNDTWVSLPDELMEDPEGEGWKNAKTLNISKTAGNLEVRLVKAGQYKSYWSYYYDYTVKVAIKNKGKQKMEVYIDDSAVVMGGKQYTDPSISPYSSAGYPDDIYPGAEITKTLEFSNADEYAGEKALYMDVVMSYGSTLEKKSFVFKWK